MRGDRAAVNLAASPGQIIEAPGVRLRPFRESDADDITAGCADPLTQRFVSGMPSPYTRDDALSWITTGAPAVWASGGAVFAVADPQTDRLFGAVGTGRVIAERAQAEIGYWVVPWARGRGVARAAAAALASWAFARGYARLELLTLPENAASQRVAIAAGFRREGLRRGGTVGRDGSRYDVVAWARLADDPPGPTPRLLPDLPGGALTDGMVTLRPLAPEDADFLYGLHALPDVVATSVPPVVPDPAEIGLRCERAQSRWLAGERADLVILDATTGTPAGEIGLYYQEPQTGQAMVGYCQLPAWRGRGYVSRATRLLARWAFDEAGIGRLVAGTKPDNVASQRVLAHSGFHRECLQRARLPGLDGQRFDDVLFALLPGDLR
jgi:RimJ/RimL family protein N-acetyltransferase